MQKTYAKDGLVVLTAAIDDLSDKHGPKTRASLEGYLQNKLKAPFKTVHLDPKSAKLFGVTKGKEGKLRADGVPVVFVFNREGKYALKLPTYDDKEDEKDAVDYDKVEKAVRELTRK